MATSSSLDVVKPPPQSGSVLNTNNSWAEDPVAKLNGTYNIPTVSGSDGIVPMSLESSYSSQAGSGNHIVSLSSSARSEEVPCVLNNDGECSPTIRDGDGEGNSKDEERCSIPKITTVEASPKTSTVHHRHHLGHTRADSAASSAGSGEHSSSSSSSLLSHDSSFVSREVFIKQLQSDLSMAASDSKLSGSGSSDGTDKDEIITQLLEHIVALKMDLLSLKEENKQLRSTRSDMDDELHTLTENLFEEAYKMVDEAKGTKVVAEKKLADAAGKIEAMETEMSALKNLLHTHGNVMSADRPEEEGIHDKHSLGTHVHHKHRKSSVKKVIKKITKKASGGKLGGGSSSSSSSKLSTKHLSYSRAVKPITLVEHKAKVKGQSLMQTELSENDFSEFKDWLRTLSSKVDHAYLDKIIKTDLLPCLTFKDEKLSREVLKAVKENNLILETLSNFENSECSLSHDEVKCTHRLKLGDSEKWHLISRHARDRIVAACDFYMCVGHIHKGLIKMESIDLYWQVSRLRAIMSLSRLSLSLPEEN